MQRFSRLVSFAAGGAFALAAVPAQDPAAQATAGTGAAPPEARSSVLTGPRSAAFGNAECRALLERDGELWGLGDRFKARFLADGVEFTPALGRKAERNLPLRLTTTAIGRGRAFVEPAAPDRQHQGLRVDYRRGAVVERYEVTGQGIEQSFVFQALPGGDGDLTVRLALQTELAVTPAGEGLRLELPGVGGCTIGGVTGIDADGRRQDGKVAFRDGVLELSLPAAFVAQAALPLVLDPLIGSVFNAFTSDVNDTDPDVAYDVTNDLYLVVFERIFSASDHDVHGQRVRSDGTLVGGRIFIDNSVANDGDVVVANINQRDRFVVAYTRGNDIMAQSVNAADGAIGPQITVASGTDNQQQPDIGGESTTADDDAICVWWNVTQNRIEACQIGVNTDGTIYAWDTTTIYESASVTPSLPRISKGGGSTGNHMIAWQRRYSATDSDPACAIVSRELTILDALRSLDSALTDQRSPDVDGDGTHWVVAWQTEDQAFPGTWDISCRAVSWAPGNGGTIQGTLVSGIVPVTADANDNEYTASVVWTGGSVLVGWTDLDSPNYNSYFKSLDPFTCLACESGGQYWLNASQNWDYWWKGCSQASGGGNDVDALLIVETHNNTASTSDIQAQRWQSRDGLVSDLGGGCGSPDGSAYTTCAILGNASFTVRLAGGNPSQPAWLVVSRDQLGLPCGSCRLIPDPFTGFVQAVTTSGTGQAAWTAALPNVPAITGLRFYAQWIVTEPVTPSCYLFQAHLSPAISLSIQ